MGPAALRRRGRDVPQPGLPARRRVPVRPADLRDLCRLLGIMGRAGRQPHLDGVEHAAKVRRIDHAHRPALGKHDRPLRRRRGGRRLAESQAGTRTAGARQRRPAPVAARQRPCRRDEPVRRSVVSLVRVHNFSISLDGFGTGEPQSHDAPFGHAGERLHEWMFTTRWWREMAGEPGGTRGLDDAFVRLHDPGIGAEIMGAGKFGYPGWHEDPEWKGWWGSDPPFHTPVFVLTHHPRPSIEMEGGTTFHFLDVSPAEALETAREAADGQDVRIGGGATVIRDFLAAELVDHMHIVVVPILLGRGVRLWDGLEGLEQDYEVEAISSPSGVTHVTFTRAGV